MAEEVRRLRNPYVDIMRGTAILLVVLGHTMTGCTLNSQDSFLYNIVWSLQMPLFVLISGYVTQYGKKITTRSLLGIYIKRRTIAYLLPWVVWTFFVRGVIFGKIENFNISQMFWNMDSGYWFLITIWTISIICGLASFGANRMIRRKATERDWLKDVVITGVLYFVGMLILVIIGLLFGLTFFCIKLTLYYMPFYFVGYAFGSIQEKIKGSKHGEMVIQIAVAVSLTVWVFIISRFNLFEIEDSIWGILIRGIASITGCIAVSALCKEICVGRRVVQGLSWCGIHSLEIYLIHYFVLNILQPLTQVEMITVAGVTVIIVNYVLTISLTVLIARLLNVNPIVRKVLFGKA